MDIKEKILEALVEMKLNEGPVKAFNKAKKNNIVGSIGAAQHAKDTKSTGGMLEVPSAKKVGRAKLQHSRTDFNKDVMRGIDQAGDERSWASKRKSKESKHFARQNITNPMYRAIKPKLP